MALKLLFLSVSLCLSLSLSLASTFTDSTKHRICSVPGNLSLCCCSCCSKVEITPLMDGYPERHLDAIFTAHVHAEERY